jgi:hyperosmotically inducible protein
MRLLFGLALGICLGAGGVMYLQSSRGKAQVQAAGQKIENAAISARDAVEDKLRVLDLRTNDFGEELSKTGRVIRQKAKQAGRAIADATADARISGAIKAKLVASQELSAMSIAVSTTDGVVTLSGAVPSPEAISHAMLLAMETDGVREVISTLQVKKPQRNQP